MPITSARKDLHLSRFGFLAEQYGFIRSKSIKFGINISNFYSEIKGKPNMTAMKLQKLSKQIDKSQMNIKIIEEKIGKIRTFHAKLKKII